MRLALIPLAVAAGLGFAQPARAAEEPASSFKGIWISTPFPAFSVAASQSITLDMTVHNSGLPPQRVGLDVSKAPDGWTGVFLGDGKRVDAVFVAPGAQASVKLRLEPSTEAVKGTYKFEVAASSQAAKFTLPVDISIGDVLPPRLSVRADLPTLRGSPGSNFEFKSKIRNEGGGDAVVRLEAGVPPGFNVKFTEEYGSQELTSFPLKAGDEKSITAKVDMALSTKAGTYPFVMRAATGQAEADTQFTMEVTGQAKLILTGQGERLSAQAYAAEETPIEILITNTGSAAARNLKLSATQPSGWKVAFVPESLDVLAPGANQTVTANVTPSARAIAGDYMVGVSASGDGISANADFRTTVRTSTMWGIVGVLVIAAALIVLVLAVVRYGRR